MNSKIKFWYINIGSENYLVSSGNRQSPKPIYNLIYVIQRIHQATMSETT